MFLALLPLTTAITSPPPHHDSSCVRDHKLPSGVHYGVNLELGEAATYKRLPGWQLTSQVGLDTDHYGWLTLYIQSNGTNGAVDITPVQVYHSWTRFVAGSPNNEPAWASWLMPLQSQSGFDNSTYPIVVDQQIPAGQAYYVEKEYDRETGQQVWSWVASENSDMEGKPNEATDPIDRNRIWDKNIHIREQVR